MAKIGAEMGQMQELQSTFNQQSQAVQQLTAAINGKVNGTLWEGPAADRFRQAWEGQFQPTLRELQAALQEAAQEVGRRHQALMQAGS